MLKECGCLPYYYPRLDAILQFQEGFENLTAACTLDGWKCLMSNVDILEAVDPMSHNTGDNVEVQKLTGAKYVPSVRPSLSVNKTDAKMQIYLIGLKYSCETQGYCPPKLLI